MADESTEGISATELTEKTGAAAPQDVSSQEGSVPEGGSAQAARVLNQDEIDMLLGFNNGGAAEGGSQGLSAILDKSITPYEKMPMMEVVFDRLVRNLTTSLRNFTSENIDASINSMASLRFDEYLNSVSLPALLVVFRAVEWENFGIITVDSSLIYSVVDVLLGGRKTNKPARVEGRPYTTIEQDIVKRMVHIVLNDMGLAFDPLSPVSFQYERLEGNPRFATIARPANAALLVKLRIDMEERGGIIEILLPHATLEPIKDLLSQMFMGEKFGQDTVWERHFGKEVRQTNIDLEVILDEKKLLLGEVVKFKVGSTILLDRHAEADVLVRCQGMEFFKAKVGRMGDNMAISITDIVRKTQD